MPLLAIDAGWDGSSDVTAVRVRGMLGRLARRGLAPPVIVQASGATFGTAQTAGDSAVEPSAVHEPIHDAASGLLVVLDGRIDNRAELIAAAGCSPSSRDGELVLRSYQKWGPALADRIVGDFALAVWDGRQRTLYAARDPSGVKALYFCYSPARILASNDVESLLGRVDPRNIDHQVVLDFLTTRFGHYQRTFFRDVIRLQPGHYLLATPGSCRQIRYFFPPTEEVRCARPEDYAGEFRRLLTVSVRDRLRSPGPIVAHLSGGLDSTSIVLLADEIYKHDPEGRPPLHTASAVYPGLDCDESAAIAATGARVGFAAERWMGIPAQPGLEPASVAWPGSPAPFSGGSTGDLEIARRLGARVILSGGGGDELSHGAGVFRDLAAAGQWLALLRQTVGPGRFTWRDRYRYLLDGMVGALPSAVVARYHQLGRSRPGAPPPWLAPTLRDIWPGERDPWETPDLIWRSSLQRSVWQALASITWALPMDYHHHYAAEAGVEIRFPFLDRRLISFVLAIPWQQRMPDGYLRRLQWQALEDRLPREVFARVTTFESARISGGQKAAGHYRELFANREWRAGEYVNQAQALALLEQTIAKTITGSAVSLAERRAMSRDWQTLRRLATVETWLRTVFRYSPEPEERL